MRELEVVVLGGALLGRHRRHDARRAHPDATALGVEE
jgi:hypothetical protein